MRIAALSIFAIALCGCQTTNNLGSAKTGNASLTDKAAGAIAEDMAGRIAEQLAPAGRSFVVVGERPDFGMALETSLKGWGLAAASDEGADRDTGATEVAYSVFDLDGKIMVRVSTPGATIARSYAPSPQSAVPSSPLSVIRFN